MDHGEERAGSESRAASVLNTYFFGRLTIQGLVELPLHPALPKQERDILFV